MTLKIRTAAQIRRTLAEHKGLIVPAARMAMSDTLDLVDALTERVAALEKCCREQHQQPAVIHAPFVEYVDERLTTLPTTWLPPDCSAPVVEEQDAPPVAGSRHGYALTQKAVDYLAAREGAQS